MLARIFPDLRPPRAPVFWRLIGPELRAADRRSKSVDKRLFFQDKRGMPEIRHNLSRARPGRYLPPRERKKFHD